MDKNSFMPVIVSDLQGQIYNHERIRDNHAKNKDQKNVDYLNWRISKYEEAIEILKEAETSKKPALNIADVITPFWLWLVREANVEVIDAEAAIEVWGFPEHKNSLVPVITLPELIELYKTKNGL